MDMNLKTIGILCPVSNELMKVPVRLDPCNHVVDRSVLSLGGHIVCPICEKQIIGYARSAEVELKVDEVVRKWLHPKTLKSELSLTHMDTLAMLVTLYGAEEGSDIYFERSKPYTFVTKQKGSSWGFLRYIVDKLFFMFSLVPTLSLCYLV
jgi:hypothetical protein